MAIFGPTMSATPEFRVQIEPYLTPCKQYVKPDDVRKGYHKPTMSTKHPPSCKVSRIMRAKAKKTPTCSVSLIAIELEGLAAPGEALKIIIISWHDAQGFGGGMKI